MWMFIDRWFDILYLYYRYILTTYVCGIIYFIFVWWKKILFYINFFQWYCVRMFFALSFMLENFIWLFRWYYVCIFCFYIFLHVALSFQPYVCGYVFFSFGEPHLFVPNHTLYVLMFFFVFFKPTVHIFSCIDEESITNIPRSKIMGPPI